ncbi:GerAB/ArcD/ProY family transporter [Ureibacillus manganicus]|uniref:MFS transporter permease n=1 Tax=Ureibacillus manganicus DSM 26584 TaxID=1384049 RepID=A0A0A3HZQ5_9BACL|nr:GerAB/ArcD/ProY family transporter [Ureibacillus manganicus]KGR78081.1 MFS transporter permease [Ureibacillus manganicus DSM 26584]
MSRYYYYLVLINMFANIITSVPVVLFQNRKDGAILSMVLALIVGVCCIYFFTNFFNSFPGKTLPDMLKQTMPKWFSIIFTFVLVIVWFVAGLITLITYTILLIRFLTPETSLIMGTITILLFVTFGCFMKAEKVLYTIEIIFVITMPLILFIFLIGYFNTHIEWQYIKVAYTFINTFPQIFPFAAALYLFLGVMNLIIFNQFFTVKQTFGWKQLFIITIIGAGVLFTTYFIPIGFQGFENIDTMMYPWISTADSMRLKYGVIERVVFIFLLFYLAFSVISLLIHWHVTIELLKSVFNFNKLKIRGIQFIPFIVISIFSIITIIAVQLINELNLYFFTTYFFVSFLFLVPCLMLVLWIVKRRFKHHEKKTS